MSERLKTMRHEQVWLLMGALSSASERLRRYRKLHPAINEMNFGDYVDGSSLEDFGSTGAATPQYRMWQVGTLKGNAVYLYEQINMRQTDDDGLYVGTDEYLIAVDDPEKSTYGGHKDGKRTIDLDTLENKHDFSIDMMVLLRDALDEFFSTDEAFKQAVRDYTRRISHPAEARLSF